MAPKLEDLDKLYHDTQTCAKIVGLDYVANEEDGLTRAKRGKGFSYLDAKNKAVADNIKKRIESLVIPPAWKEVWICPSDNGHVLATGIDERGRKQYVYHPKWRTMRDLIKFYRTIAFARSLPKIRKTIDHDLALDGLGREKVMAMMLWILDNVYIRIGNDVYFEANASIGLTTLTDKNIVIAGPVVTLSFVGKSGKDQQITFENKLIAEALDELRQVRGARLFRYKDVDGWHDIDSTRINHFLQEVTGASISAKDFRTWGGTLMAFIHLIDEAAADEKKPEKVVIEAIDQAAAVLGNTRTVARSSYVHPHILAAYSNEKFSEYFAAATKQRKLTGLDKHESELLYFLENLFEREFTLLKQQ